MAVTRSAVKGATQTAKKQGSALHTAPKPKTRNGDPDHVSRTQDGHHIVVNNRKWRATDPLIPADSLQELKHFLAIGRSGSRKSKDKSEDDIKRARQFTALAKLGLGERGQPEWWQDSETSRRKRWEDALAKLRLLEKDPSRLDDDDEQIAQDT